MKYVMLFNWLMVNYELSVKEKDKRKIKHIHIN
jgi:hypothetical protein